MTEVLTNSLNTAQNTLLQGCERSRDGFENLGMDKSNKRFCDVLESKNYQKTQDLNKTSKNINMNSDVKNENGSIGDIKKALKKIESINRFEDFRNFLGDVISEANAETALNLTLTKDVDADCASGSAETCEFDVSASIEENLQNNLQEEVVNNLSTQTISDTVNLVEKISSNTLNELSQNQEEEDLNTLLESSLEVLDFNQTAIDEATETTLKQVLAKLSNVTEKEIAKDNEEIENPLETILDDEKLKELSLESIDFDTETSAEDSFMQQSPEESGMKALLHNDAGAFDANIEKAVEAKPVQSQAKPVEVSSNKIIEQITKQLDKLNSTSKLNIVLNPESLGKVTVQLVKSAEGMSAQFTVSTAEAKEVLMKDLNNLKDTLTAQGVNVENVSVKLNDTQKSSYNQDWTEQEGSRGGNKEQKEQQKQKDKNLFEQIIAESENDLKNG